MTDKATLAGDRNECRLYAELARAGGVVHEAVEHILSLVLDGRISYEKARMYFEELFPEELKQRE